MAKAINWSKEFYDEVMNEDSQSPRIALRLGSLYFDNGYYANDETIDIRVDHKVVRKAQIIEDMQLAKIKDLSEDTLKMYKNSLKQKNNVINFLADNYNKPVDNETFVTIIKYKNLPIEEINTVDDPHS